MARTWCSLFVVIHIVLSLNFFSLHSFTFHEAREDYSANISVTTESWHNDSRDAELDAIIESVFSPNATLEVRSDTEAKVLSSTISPLSPTALPTNTRRLEISDSYRRSTRVCNIYGIEMVNAFAEEAKWLQYGGKLIYARPKIRRPPHPRTEVCKSSPYRYIHGGSRVERGSSHVVALGRMNEDKQFTFLCGGSLITSKWVLTAAHCTHGVDGGPTIARVGVLSLSDNRAMIIPINQTIRHPSYKPPALYADIALLQLETSVPFNTTLRPACLSVDVDYSWESSVLVCGWGATEFGGDVSDHLQEASLKILDNAECEKTHNFSIPAPYGIGPSMMCAGPSRNGRLQDTCRGDSGGPLQIAHPEWRCLNQVIGITSFGAGCAFGNVPGVYTRVSYYLDWIESVLWPRQWPKDLDL